MDADSNFDLDADADANPETRMWVDREKKWENMAFKFTHNCFDASGSLISLGLSEEGRLLFFIGCMENKNCGLEELAMYLLHFGETIHFQFFPRPRRAGKVDNVPVCPVSTLGKAYGDPSRQKGPSAQALLAIGSLRSVD